jgi:hypothetical protein
MPSCLTALANYQNETKIDYPVYVTNAVNFLRRFITIINGSVYWLVTPGVACEAYY